ncbi:MAG: hypothetical protein DDT32_02280 [Syntrophomonadaceae bacterium]|nr:hypothetical protein [Bacillota bacterium]
MLAENKVYGGERQLIFQAEHIEMIQVGTKTQTRRSKRGTYQVGRTYAVQPGRGKRGVLGLRIEILSIWSECLSHISIKDAWEEGGYTPADYIALYRALHKGKPQQHPELVWVFSFKVIHGRR